MHHKSFKPLNRQHGLTLLLVLMLLAITVSASLYFHQRLVSSSRLSGATRDNSASLMLAESAMEMLRGGFINTLDSLPNADFEATCGSLGNSYDNCEAYLVINNIDNPSGLETTLKGANLDYVFYVGPSGIAQTTPSILQGVANGGGAASDATHCAVTSRAISSPNCKLKIESLFNTGQGPALYATNANGLLVTSTAASWNAELANATNNGSVAAAWLELTLNPEQSDAVDIWVQATAQVGAATSFIQRYVGTYYPTDTLGSLAALIEASNIDRRIPL